ncbi:serine/threonine-protein kinase, partial [Zavarzinella formosa]|uniref:serine/threonine-protein kinase n=1 Tax=Zavarzinella formosa TaxID=360055 RepID=UPI00138AFF24
MPDSQVLGTAGRATPPGRDADTGLSLQAGLRVERRCHAFEREWRGGLAPGIESYLADSPPEDRAGLLAALLPLEWEYRIRRGETPDAGEYRRRFPEVGSHFAGLDSPAPAPRLPELPNYEVIRELGRGGMGLVCLANDRRLDRPVALKVMLGGELASTELRRRFLAEARSAARLRHPNIVQIYEVAEAAGLPVLVLEYVAGGTLKQRLAAGRPPLREAAGLMEQLALAVHHAHENGVIHRDLKPQNVLLAPGGLVPKLADFGLAKAVSEAAGLTRTGEALGTPAYMAPEQFAGRPELIGPPTDVYGLG